MPIVSHSCPAYTLPPPSSPYSSPFLQLTYYPALPILTQ
jgi:hypothetical protein